MGGTCPVDEFSWSRNGGQKKGRAVHPQATGEVPAAVGVPDEDMNGSGSLAVF